MLQSVLNFIKTTSKRERVLIVAFLILTMLSVCILIHDITRPATRIVQSPPKLVPTIIYRDKDGKENATIKEKIVTKDQMQEETKDDKKKLKARSIESETTIVDQADTDYKNKYGMKMPNDTISIKRYTTKKWFLAPVVSDVNITHSDTSIHTILGSSLSYKEPRVLVVFGPTIGINPFNQKLIWGVSATFNVISIKSRR